MNLEEIVDFIFELRVFICTEKFFGGGLRRMIEKILVEL